MEDKFTDLRLKEQQISIQKPVLRFSQQNTAVTMKEISPVKPEPKSMGFDKELNTQVFQLCSQATAVSNQDALEVKHKPKMFSCEICGK